MTHPEQLERIAVDELQQVEIAASALFRGGMRDRPEPDVWTAAIHWIEREQIGATMLLMLLDGAAVLAVENGHLIWTAGRVNGVEMLVDLGTIESLQKPNVNRRARDEPA